MEKIQIAQYFEILARASREELTELAVPLFVACRDDASALEMIGERLTDLGDRFTEEHKLGRAEQARALNKWLDANRRDLQRMSSQKVDASRELIYTLLGRAGFPVSGGLSAATAPIDLPAPQGGEAAAGEDSKAEPANEATPLRLLPGWPKARAVWTCENCGAARDEVLQTIAGLPFATAACPECSHREQIGPEVLEAAGEAIPLELGYAVAEEASRIAESWHHTAPWREPTRRLGFPLGRSIELELQPVLARILLEHRLSDPPREGER